MTRDRWLERALIANFAVHGIALVAMAALLLAALPGGARGSWRSRTASASSSSSSGSRS
jgi:hypothetical protein